MKTKNQEAVRLDLKAIGRRIREIRGFDLKQTEFAEILGISLKTLHNKLKEYGATAAAVAE